MNLKKIGLGTLPKAGPAVCFFALVLALLHRFLQFSLVIR